MTFDDAASRLETVAWTFAKTMPNNPHYWTLRKAWPGGSEDFEAVVQFIRDAGHTIRFGRTDYRCLNVNGWRYWTMGSPLDQTTLINRCRLNTPCLYDEIAPVYEEMHATPEAAAENVRLFEMIGCRGGSVLDIGCGTGLFLDCAAPDEYCGIDPSGRMLERLGKKYPTARTIQTPLESFWSGRKYDLVVSLFGAASYVTPDAVERARRWVHPYGRLVMMFYKPGYVPVTHLQSGVAVPFFEYTGPGVPFGNYVIAGGGVNETVSAEDGLRSGT